MRAYCISGSNCQYKTDTGYCGYTGMGCAQGLVRSVKIDEPSYKIVQQVDISTESINKIAEAVVEKLRNCGVKMVNEADVAEVRHGKWIFETLDGVPGYRPTDMFCSKCGRVSIADYSYCPNCGAKMDGEEI